MQALWDNAAATFDHAPDHGLRDPAVRAAWRNLLAPWLPPKPSRALDIGCGTGSLSVLLSELGHKVTGIDFSPAMIALAEGKALAAGQQIALHVMDATQPHFSPQQFDLIICRHLLWTLPEPAQALTRWANLLVPGGRMLLVEGFWHTEVGLHAQEVIEALPASLGKVTWQALSDQAALWGGVMHDERYLIVAVQPITEDDRCAGSTSVV